MLFISSHKLFIYFSILIFILGIYFYTSHTLEGFQSNTNNAIRCPDILIQDGIRIYLYNSKIAKVPGVNPIEFNNLDEYTEFLQWQRKNDIKCPVLFLQKNFNAQGQEVYNIRPSPFDPQGGLPPSKIAQSPSPPTTLLTDATQSDKPYNKNSYPAQDQTNQNIGSTTPLDNMNTTNTVSGHAEDISYNPMDDNWAGSTYTQSLIDKGFFKENEVNIFIP